jgi:F-box protein 18 (helicase)
VMLQVLLNQKAHKVIVGDVHQQIYAWRQAVNSLQQVPFPAYSLSSSFRFPDEIAAMARRVLAWKQLFDEPVAFSGLRGLGSHGGPIQSRATLARSNLFLLDRAIQLLHEERLERLWFEGNLAAYTFASDGTSLFDVLALYNGQHSKVRDPMLKSLGSFEKLEAYLEKAEDPELLMLTEMVRKHGSDLPSYINRLKNMQVQPEARHQADMIFSTVHRSKGLEYDEVQLTADFITEDKFLRALREKDKGRQLRLNEEINLLYVAMTRARQRLLLPLSLWPAGPVQPVAEALPTELPGYARRRKQAAFDRADQRQWQWGQLVSEAEADFLTEHQLPNDWLQSQLAYLRREAMKVP